MDELLEFSKQAVASGSSAIYYNGDKIVPLDQRVVPRLDKYQLDLAALDEENPKYKAAVEAAIQNRYMGGRYKTVHLSCRYANVIAVYDKSSLMIVDTLDVPTSLSAAAIDEPLSLRIQLDINHVKHRQDE